jgi:D-alanyl-D-alanine carboxypeptidase/D-alanyl-D-alanine-endopeptidase (penicillin-binding protein 4)
VLAGALLVLTAGLLTRDGDGSRAAADPDEATSSAGSTADPSPSETAAVAAPGEVLAAIHSDAASSPEGVRAALTSLLSDASLSGLGALVVDPATGESLLERSASTAHIPASTTKILTAVAALSVLGPDTTFDTSVVANSPGQLVLVGGGDPALSQRDGSSDGWPYAVTSLADLADDTASALRSAGIGSAAIAYDASLFDGPALQPGWPSRYVSSGDVGPITALSVDGGRERPGYALRSADPAAYAAQKFVELLGERGISATLSGAGTATPRAAAIATVTSPPVSDLVNQMLTRSDNDAAETLGRHVALALGEPATFAGAGAAVASALADLDVPTPGLSLVDTSGLSRDDRIAPMTLVAALSLAVDDGHPALRSMLSGLPIGGFSGTLADRFDDDQVAAVGDPLDAGDIRAKTGYLRSVVTLAGYVVDADDEVLVFAFLASPVPTGKDLDAQAALDGLAIRLAGCGCA